MLAFDVERKETVFDCADRYVFKQYFEEEEDLFQLEKHYNSDKYGLEILEENLPKVRQILDNYFYGLELVGDINNFYIIQEIQLDSSDLLRNAVSTQCQRKYEIFLMNDKLSTKQAVEKGATAVQKFDFKSKQIQWEIDGS